MAKQTRPLYEVAAEVRKDWRSKDGKPNVWFGAEPWLQALEGLDKVTDNYFAESGDMVVRYFLGNATKWRGDVARRVKAELKEMLSR